MPLIRFLFSIDGRVRRREFFLFALVLGALFLNWLAGLRDLARASRVYSNTATDGYLLNLLTHSGTHYATLGLIMVVGYTVAAKRLHDRGRSGWWQMLVFVPVIGWAWLLLELFILPGSPAANRFGPHPTWDQPAESEWLDIR